MYWYPKFMNLSRLNFNVCLGNCMCTLYAFMGVIVMCAWIWLVYWHFAAILVSLTGQ